MRPTIRHMLTEIPDLAVEVWLTRDAPNPDGTTTDRSVRTRREHPPAPTNLDVLDAFRWHSERGQDATWLGGILDGLCWAERVAYEALVRAGEEVSKPVEKPTVSAEAAWLLASIDDWQAVADQVEIKMIDDWVYAAWTELRRMARVPREKRYLCPTVGCGELMHPAFDGDMMACLAGHEHPGPARLERIWRRHPPLTADEIGKQLHVDPKTIRQWRRRSPGGKPKITAVDDQETPMRFWPWDVIGVLYPDIVRDIAARDQMEA